MMFWMCPAFVPPLKANVTTRTTTQITSRSGVATKDMRTMPRAGTRKARALFTLTKLKVRSPSAQRITDLSHIKSTEEQTKKPNRKQN